MIVPEPSLLSSSPLPSEPPSEPHTQDDQDDESEDSLPLRKRHRRDMSEEALDRVFNGLNDILQRNERLKTQAKKKHKKLERALRTASSQWIWTLSIIITFPASPYVSLRQGIRNSAIN